MGIVTIHRVVFTEDEIAVKDEHGNVVEYYDPPYDDEHTYTEVYDDLTAREAVDRLRREGLSFEATGSDWAADPDGSYISNYGTGQRTMTSGHLSGFHPRVAAAIACVTDKKG